MPFRRAGPLAALLLPLRLLAQAPTDSGAAAAARAGDSAPDTIRAVVIDRRDIFDPQEQSWFARAANGLHVMTRAHVVERELLFEAGEPYDSAKIAESERNLRAVGVFRRVRIDTVRTDSGLVARVVTRDGWSTQADWRFRSAGGDVALTIGLVEANLLGTATSAAVRYSRNPDRSTVTLGFRQPRLFAGTVGLGLTYEDRSDGMTAAAALERPFFSLASRSAFGIAAERRDERVLRFFNGEDVASDSLRRHYTLVRASAARSLRPSRAGYLRAGLTAQLRRDDFRPESASGDFPSTVTAAVGGYLTWSRAAYLVARGVAGFAREEDVDLGFTVRVRLLAAPKLFGYERDGLGPQASARVGFRLPSGFAYAEALGQGLVSTAGVDSGAVQLAGTAVLQPASRQLAVLHLEGGWLESPLLGSEFDLGLGEGPRAFGSHAFTGDRMVFATAEYRYTVADDLFGLVGLGMAGFVEHGGAWYAGSRRRLGWDAGIGIRLGTSRSADTEALRFDLARRFANDVESGGWVVVVGKGFVFSPLGRRAL